MKKGFRDIAQRLAEEIRSGRYQNGQLFPRRIDLVKRLGASRVTIDRGIHHLVAQGLLISKKGSGTYVSIPRERRHRLAVIGLPGPTEKLSPPDDCQLELIDYQQVENPSQRAKLLDFEGLIWRWPENAVLPWIDEFQGRVPQILLNREIASHNYVSTDHAGAIFRITSQRLGRLPQAVPIFLRLEGTSDNLVVNLRESGFVRACRKEGRFYEILHLPHDYDRRIDRLQECSDQHPRKCLLIVSGSIDHTGAVIQWVRTTGRQWKKTVFYSDFDDAMDRQVWGITVTSFLQNHSKIAALAIENLLALIRKKKTSVHILIPSDFVEGDT